MPDCIHHPPHSLCETGDLCGTGSKPYPGLTNVSSANIRRIHRWISVPATNKLGLK
jgi:hypothetical protein